MSDPDGTMDRVGAVRSSVEYRSVDDTTATRANRADWDAHADDYQAAHGSFLGDASFVWCPEGVREEDVGMLGETAGMRVAELGCGAAQCSRWLHARGVRAVGIDISIGQLRHGRRLDTAVGVAVPVACAPVQRLPFPDGSVDIAFSAFGALSFVVDLAQACREVARILRPGGRLAFSVTHPARWMFPDDPTWQGLTIRRSYFDRSSYVEVGEDGEACYVEPHHTLEDWFASLTTAGFTIQRLIEPRWPDGFDRVWGGWGPERGALLPGTLMIAATTSGGSMHSSSVSSAGAR